VIVSPILNLHFLRQALQQYPRLRATCRPDAIPLGPIRSLHYFLPVIEELLHTPLSHGNSYLAYLRTKVPLRPDPAGKSSNPKT
jgi:hypothetical protein